MSEQNSVISSRTEASLPLRDCERRFIHLENEVDGIKIILVGKDGRDGLVYDLNTVLYHNRNIGILVQAIITVIVTVITALILRWGSL